MDLGKFMQDAPLMDDDFNDVLDFSPHRTVEELDAWRKARLDELEVEV